MSALRLVASRRLQATTTRTFITSARLRSNGSHMASDPEVVEREKHRNLKKDPNQHAPHSKHAPGWNETLASTSEAFIKADQSPSETPEELTKVTIEHVKKVHHSEDAGGRVR